MPPALIPAHHAPHPLLLVDDDPVVRETLSDLLKSEGFKVSAAGSGEEAEFLIRGAQPPFDLVLTDLVMPGKGGMDVLKCALQKNPSCTVLVLSGFGTVREATEAMDAGAYGMLTKPLHLDQFRHTLRRILERIALITERDFLRQQVRTLESRIASLETIQGRMEMLAQRMGPPPEPGGGSLGELERLGKLRSQALLSEEEFDSAKRALLARWRT